MCNSWCTLYLNFKICSVSELFVHVKHDLGFDHDGVDRQRASPLHHLEIDHCRNSTRMIAFLQGPSPNVLFGRPFSPKVWEANGHSLLISWFNMNRDSHPLFISLCPATELGEWIRRYYASSGFRIVDFLSRTSSEFWFDSQTSFTWGDYFCLFSFSFVINLGLNGSKLTLSPKVTFVIIGVI